MHQASRNGCVSPTAAPCIFSIKAVDFMKLDLRRYFKIGIIEREIFQTDFPKVPLAVEDCFLSFWQQNEFFYPEVVLNP